MFVFSKKIMFIAAFSLTTVNVAHSEETSQQSMLQSTDSALEANKRLVYDFYRVVFEGLHMEKAGDYLSDEYVQHNPNVKSGRDNFVRFFSSRGKPKSISDSIQAPLISIMAERDLVTLVFERSYTDKVGKTYSSTWFDMFRVQNGKITEHWDPAQKK